MKSIRSEIKNFKGFVLGIGNFDKDFLSEVMKNDSISFSILSSNTETFGVKSKKHKKLVDKKKKKAISINKIKKAFKKNKPNYTVVDINEVKDNLKTFIKDSLYITKEKMYIYTTNNQIDIKEIFNLYKRYNKNVVLDNGYIIIDMEKYRNNIFKNMFYYIVDTFVSIYYFISNVLTS